MKNKKQNRLIRWLQSNKSITEIVTDLKLTNNKIATLEKEKAFLSKQLKRQNSLNKSQSQKLRSISGSIAAAREKAQALKTALKLQKKQDSISTNQSRKQSALPKSILNKMDKKERKELYKNTLYLPQFIERLQEHYGDQWTAEMSANILRVLRNLSINDINEILNFLDITKMYYESDQIYTDADISLEADYVYKTIMSYDD